MRADARRADPCSAYCGVVWRCSGVSSRLSAAVGRTYPDKDLRTSMGVFPSCWKGTQAQCRRQSWEEYSGASVAAQARMRPCNETPVGVVWRGERAKAARKHLRLEREERRIFALNDPAGRAMSPACRLRRSIGEELEAWPCTACRGHAPVQLGE